MFAGFFFMIFITFLFLIIIGGSILRGILNLLFGRNPFGQPSGSAREHYTRTEQPRQSQSQQATSSAESKKREKLFDKSDGEYVDFEEIKD